VRIRSKTRPRWRQVPVGMRDQTADEVAARRHLEARLLEVFRRWGYEEVATPALEYLDTLTHGAGPGIADRLLKLVDSGGEVLTLRPEMTVPLARFAAARLLPAGRRPLRLSYVASVYRGQERGSGRPREFVQAGVELLGAAPPHADVEVIALAAEALGAAGADGAALSVGHAGFLRGLLASLPEQAADATRDLLYRRAFADLGAVVPPGPALETLRLLPTLRGPDALARAEELAVSTESLAALEVLRLILDGVTAYAPPVPIGVDLGLIRDFEYYSGVVFEAHAPKGGMSLLGGGRYDDLVGRFGHPAAATGFAMGLEPVLGASSHRAERRRVVAVRSTPEWYREAAGVAVRLRRAGLAAVVATAGADLEEAACVVRVGGGRLAVEDGTAVYPATTDDLEAVVRGAVERG
jgi:ATP phosphoribosyltransferase regulatory subunit